MTFLLAQKEKERFCIESFVCPQYTFSLPDSGNCYFLVFQNACPNMTNLPQAIKQVLILYGLV